MGILHKGGGGGGGRAGGQEIGSKAGGEVYERREKRGHRRAPKVVGKGSNWKTFHNIS